MYVKLTLYDIGFGRVLSTYTGGNAALEPESSDLLSSNASPYPTQISKPTKTDYLYRMGLRIIR
ncbi:hypothetical protein ACTXT7_012745 [Hymenolepis weldensis]